MIYPIRWLWEQLNGPQIKGVAQGIFGFLQQKLDKYLDYLNNLSLETANASHLDLMGVLMGLAHPIVQVRDAKFFFFTENAQHGTTHGFSATEDPADVGGKFGDIGIVEATEGGQPIPVEYFRCMLIAMAQSKGIPGSIQMMDDIITGLWKKDNARDAIHTFHILDEDAEGNRTKGDIEVDLGTLQDWYDGFMVVAALQSLANTLFAPEPRWFFIIADAESEGIPWSIRDFNQDFLEDSTGARLLSAPMKILESSEGEKLQDSNESYLGVK